MIFVVSIFSVLFGSELFRWKRFSFLLEHRVNHVFSWCKSLLLKSTETKWKQLQSIDSPSSRSISLGVIRGRWLVSSYSRTEMRIHPTFITQLEPLDISVIFSTREDCMTFVKGLTSVIRWQTDLVQDHSNQRCLLSTLLRLEIQRHESSWLLSICPLDNDYLGEQALVWQETSFSCRKQHELVFQDDKWFRHRHRLIYCHHVRSWLCRSVHRDVGE